MGYELEERNPSLAQVLRLAGEWFKDQIHTAMPAEVVDFDPNTRTGTIQLALRKRVAETQEEINIPPVTNVPFYFQGGSKGYLTVPPTKGDTGTAFFSERAIGNWQNLESGGTVCPEAGRKFSYTDAMFYPGLDLIPSARPVDMDATVLEGETEVKVGAGATKFAAEAPQTDTHLSSIVTELNKVILAINILAPGTAVVIPVPLTSVAVTKVKVE